VREAAQHVQGGRPHRGRGFVEVRAKRGPERKERQIERSEERTKIGQDRAKRGKEEKRDKIERSEDQKETFWGVVGWDLKELPPPPFRPHRHQTRLGSFTSLPGPWGLCTMEGSLCVCGLGAAAATPDSCNSCITLAYIVSNSRSAQCPNARAKHVHILHVRFMPERECTIRLDTSFLAGKRIQCL